MSGIAVLVKSPRLRKPQSRIEPFMVALLNGEGVKVLSKYCIYSCRPELPSVLLEKLSFAIDSSQWRDAELGKVLQMRDLGIFFYF